MWKNCRLYCIVCALVNIVGHGQPLSLIEDLRINVLSKLLDQCTFAMWNISAPSDRLSTAFDDQKHLH